MIHESMNNKCILLWVSENFFVYTLHHNFNYTDSNKYSYNVKTGSPKTRNKNARSVFVAVALSKTYIYILMKLSKMIRVRQSLVD